MSFSKSFSCLFCTDSSCTLENYLAISILRGVICSTRKLLEISFVRFYIKFPLPRIFYNSSRFSNSFSIYDIFDSATTKNALNSLSSLYMVSIFLFKSGDDLFESFDYFKIFSILLSKS